MYLINFAVKKSRKPVSKNDKLRSKRPPPPPTRPSGLFLLGTSPGRQASLGPVRAVNKPLSGQLELCPWSYTSVRRDRCPGSLSFVPGIAPLSGGRGVQAGVGGWRGHLQVLGALGLRPLPGPGQHQMSGECLSLQIFKSDPDLFIL